MNNDSDEEYERSKRDKFRTERSTSSSTRREALYESSIDPIGYRRSSRTSSKYSPIRSEMSPFSKRVRSSDWTDRRVSSSLREANSDIGNTNELMTFKAFLSTQDDMISDEEAMKKYNEYRLNHRRQQLSDFFLSHKDEEWFKNKYHPDEISKNKSLHLANLKRRIEVFQECLPLIETISLDGDNTQSILRLLDTVVIRLEGGDEKDLAVLDMSEEDLQHKSPEETKPFVLESGNNKEKKKDQIEDLSQMKMTEEQKKLQTEAQEFLKRKKESERLKKRKKRAKKTNRNEFGSDLDKTSSDDSDISSTTLFNTSSDSSKPVSEDDEDDMQPAPPGAEVITATSTSIGADDETTADVEKTGDSSVSCLDGIVSGDFTEAGGTGDLGADKTAPESKPRALHKTTSIFMRNLAPTITKQEVEVMCRRYPGFMRVAISEPQSDRRWFRRGWVTFERSVNIKEICWNLNNIRLRECELGAIVNRDLLRRVRTVSGITSHKIVLLSDIAQAARIVQNLDQQNSLWSTTDEDGTHITDSLTKTPSYGFMSNNPVLKNIADYLIEEASAEEDELLGINRNGADDMYSSNQGSNGVTSEAVIERDESLIKVLDKVLWYLRIVHSVDYYNHCEYPNEDEMPNRCGIVHARGIPPTCRVNNDECKEYNNSFEVKISTFTQKSTKLSREEADKSGLLLKNADEEIEKFVNANTQELAKDKWLCPLSNKKFKAPDFVRKHIFNKHVDKIEEVKKEVQYYNNYLLDPKRPHNPEVHTTRVPPPLSTSTLHSTSCASASHRRSPTHSTSTKEERTAPAYHMSAVYPPTSHPAAYGYNYQRSYYGGYSSVRDPYYRDPYLPPREAHIRPPRPYNARKHNRPLNSYRDLDAPKELDEF